MHPVLNVHPSPGLTFTLTQNPSAFVSAAQCRAISEVSFRVAVWQQWMRTAGSSVVQPALASRLVMPAGAAPQPAVSPVSAWPTVACAGKGR